MSDKPNCPLVTNLRPCTCPDEPRCPVCGYTAHDAACEMDHHPCSGTIPPRLTPATIEFTNLLSEEGETITLEILARLPEAE